MADKEIKNRQQYLHPHCSCLRNENTVNLRKTATQNRQNKDLNERR